MNSLQFLPSANGEPTFALPAPDYIERVTTVAATSQTITKPAGARFALFSFPEDVWVNYGAAAAQSGASTTDGSGSELNPGLRNIEGASDIRVITTNAVTGSITFYR